MRKNIILIICGLSILTSCGGGSSTGERGGPSNGGLKTGVFFGGFVNGLAYKTESQSGLTNGRGEYRYKEGETISFSIGGVELGAASVREELELADLFELSLPSTEVEIRRELSDERQASDFDRLANALLVLFSLDNDFDPATGIDLSGWNTTLTSASIDFNVIPNSFYKNGFREFARNYGANQFVTKIQPLNFLYTYLGINPTVHQIASEERYSGGELVGRDLYEYSEDGLTKTDKKDADELGNVYETYIRTRNNDSGQLVSEIRLLNWSGGGGVDWRSVSTISYSPEGYITDSIFSIDWGEGTDITFVLEASRTYDEEGNNIIEYSELDENADGIFESEITLTFAYDDKGNRTGKLRVDDYDKDNIFEAIELDTYIYDSENRLIDELYERSIRSDGSFSNYYRTSYQYNQQGQLVERSYERDDDTSTAALDTARYETREYNEAGYFVRNTIEHFEWDNSEYPEGGDYSSITYTSHTIGENGFDTSYSTQADIDMDGNIDSEATYSYSYVYFDQLSFKVRELDSDADGEIDSIYSYEYGYVEIENGMHLLLLEYWGQPEDDD